MILIFLVEENGKHAKKVAKRIKHKVCKKMQISSILLKSLINVYGIVIISLIGGLRFTGSNSRKILLVHIIDMLEKLKFKRSV